MLFVRSKFEIVLPYYLHSSGSCRTARARVGLTAFPRDTTLLRSPLWKSLSYIWKKSSNSPNGWSGRAVRRAMEFRGSAFGQFWACRVLGRIDAGGPHVSVNAPMICEAAWRM
jgi:hypothetical protein